MRSAIAISSPLYHIISIRDGARQEKKGARRFFCAKKIPFCAFARTPDVVWLKQILCKKGKVKDYG
jgi:hypothetical protein